MVSLSLRASHRRLKETLVGELDKAYEARVEVSAIFSARHLAAFFDRASRDVLAGTEDAFDFVVASWKDNPVGLHFADHVCTFVQLCRHGSIPEGMVVSFIASAILMDSYPPGMHRECDLSPLFGAQGTLVFPPRMVYRRIYRSLLVDALRRASTADSPSAEVQSGWIESKMPC